MDLSTEKAAKKDEMKAELIALMEKEGIVYSISECGERLLIGFDDADACMMCCRGSSVIAKTDKGIRRIYMNEIIYIAINGRKTVVCLTGGKTETNYSIGYWMKILDRKIFVQPHKSYIVNLNYVARITGNRVQLKHGDIDYFVYASLRKEAEFKKAYLKFGER